jgi:hypothetical protein
LRCWGPIRLTHARADYAELDHAVAGARGALDSNPKTGWSIRPYFAQVHWAVFRAAEPFGTRAGRGCE